jgi:hypothetical protein
MIPLLFNSINEQQKTSGIQFQYLWYTKSSLARRHEDVLVPDILNLGARWKWVVSFTPRPFYPRKIALGTHLIGKLLGLRVALYAVVKEILPCPCWVKNPYRPALSLVTIYWLSYTGSAGLSMIAFRSVYVVFSQATIKCVNDAISFTCKRVLGITIFIKLAAKLLRRIWVSTTFRLVKAFEYALVIVEFHSGSMDISVWRPTPTEPPAITIFNTTVYNNLTQILLVRGDANSKTKRGPRRCSQRWELQGGQHLLSF